VTTIGPVGLVRAHDVLAGLPDAERLDAVGDVRVRLLPAARVRLRRPDFLVGLAPGERDRAEFFDMAELEMPPRFALVLEDALTVGECAVLLRDGRLFEASLFSGLPAIPRTGSADALEPLGDNRYDCGLPAGPAETVDEPTVFLGARWSRNYYHWVFEGLTRLVFLDDEQLAHFHVAVPEELPPAFLELVHAFGIDDARLHRLPRSACVRFRRLVVLPPVASDAFHIREAFDRVREVILRAAPEVAEPAGKLLVVRRDAPAPGRQLVNEEALADLFRDRGYEVLEPGSLSIPEQAARFNRASRVAAVHGSGAVNVVFCRDEARVMHLHPADVRLRAYGQVSALRDQPFGYVFGDCFSNPRRGQGVEWVLDLEAVAETADANGF